MTDLKGLKTSARDFVSEALSEAHGRTPSSRAVRSAVDRIVKAFAPVVTGAPSQPSTTTKKRKHS